MKLTKKKAIEITRKLWRHLADTGETNKEEWLEDNGYGEMHNDCPLCHFALKSRGEGYVPCTDCPYFKKYGECFVGAKPFREWADAKTKITRKKYAKLFLKELEEL